ncbi:MAG: Multi-sensor signal transduction histidine kinase [Verrucomicrobiales bacterium]|nr:Multi-sensor signal transduction histidine kinase [Verrucomicrobiales bacterium]
MKPNSIHQPTENKVEPGIDTAAGTSGLEIRLEEAEQILRAIRSGEVDAVVVKSPEGDRLFTLKGADEPYRVMIEEMNQGAVTLSNEGIILFCNRRFVALLDTDMESIIGFRFETFVMPEDRSKFLGMLKLGTRGTSSGELKLQAKDGKWVPVQLALSRLPRDSAAAICLIATDITESNKRAEALYLLNSAVMQSNESILITDAALEFPGPNILFVNPAFTRMTGYESGESIGRSPRFLQGPRTDREVTRRLRKNLENGDVFQGVTVNYRKDGSEFHLEWQIAPIRESSGKITHFVAIQRDISQRKKADSDLEEANRQLREASRQAGMAEVATSVLHNIGNVLNSVNVSCSVVSEKVRRSAIASVSRSAEMLKEHRDDLGSFMTSDPVGQKLPVFLEKLAKRLVEEQSVILSELQLLIQNIDHIKDIVAVQQDHAKHVNGAQETITPRQLVEDALRMNHSSLARHEIAIEREYGDVPAFSFEKHKVLQILVNLIRNAKHALSDSARVDKKLTLRVVAEEGGVSIGVGDNGVGIPAENMSKIFAYGFTTRKGGHGFGLHGSVLAAQEMGGSLTARSEGPGKGTFFTLKLPVTQLGNP